MGGRELFQFLQEFHEGVEVIEGVIEDLVHAVKLPVEGLEVVKDSSPRLSSDSSLASSSARAWRRWWMWDSRSALRCAIFPRRSFSRPGLAVDFEEGEEFQQEVLAGLLEGGNGTFEAFPEIERESARTRPRWRPASHSSTA